MPNRVFTYLYSIENDMSLEQEKNLWMNVGLKKTRGNHFLLARSLYITLWDGHYFQSQDKFHQQE